MSIEDLEQRIYKTIQMLEDTGIAPMILLRTLRGLLERLFEEVRKDEPS